MRIPDFTVSKFGGLNTAIKDTKTLRPGVATDAKNWLTAKFGDHIELRRGSALLGATRNNGAGKITGLGVGIRYDGTPVIRRSRGRKVEYYDSVTDDWIETGSNILPVVADGEDCWFAPYSNLAGPHTYFGSPNSGIWKSPDANPGSAVDQSISSFRFGSLRFGRGRAYAGRRNGTTAGNKDDTGLYLSDIDKALLSLYTHTTGEAFGTGDGTTKLFTHNLAAVTGVKTCMYPSVTDGVETFVDDRNALMVGNLGGTGTVNYATGAVSVTFATAPLAAATITCEYYTEDATSDGPLDFDTSSTGAGKAKIFRQDDAGPFMAVLPFLDVNYAFHLLKTYAVTTPLDDTSTTNLPYRNIGIPYARAVKETPDGILCIDVSSPNEPKIRRLEIARNTNNLTIVPTSISDALDLSVHAFDYGLVYRWGDFEIVCCQEYMNATPNDFNSVMYVRNIFSNAWDKLDFGASVLADSEGALIAGSPISNNVLTLFSGFDDDEYPIDNHWQDGQLDLGTSHLKVAHRMVVKGLIQRDQSIAVSLVLDDGNPVEVFIISGSGDYVDQGVNTPIGSYTLGSKVIGGGGEATAHPFEVDFPIHTDKFEHISARFQALYIGHAAINEYTYKDIRDKGRRSLPLKTV
ncbi:MAG: hypothetical protein ACK4UO_13065 [Pseudolabrys sp.]